ncbi:MAG: hypothetical protein N5P05_004522 (plasmid) [Chroococcopsis gigantea SAG 12.99]|jgi:hypothetical protein|nr:hypothetical protein [Chroococcopsis gigantea SAG 12.99]
MDIFNHLFYNFTQFELNQWSIEELQKKITLTLCSKQILANCPKYDHSTVYTTFLGFIGKAFQYLPKNNFIDTLRIKIPNSGFLFVTPVAVKLSNVVKVVRPRGFD